MQTTTMTESEFDALKVGGTEVNYFVICSRKLWLYTHHLEMERSSDQVSMGALLHETAYSRLPRRELLIDSLIKVDIMESSGKVIEVKYSQRMAEASKLQVLYYLYYLGRKGITGLTGELRFPRQRRIEEVKLSEKDQQRIEATLRDIKEVKDLPAPPKAEWGGICRRCAYAEFCWG